MYKLYWDRGGANMAAHALLEEIGCPYELRQIDLDKGDQRHPDYLKLNPHARVPTLVYDNDQIMYESAAITLFLADRHPDVNMAPITTDPRRGLFLQWMAYLTNTVQEALMHYHHPDFYIEQSARPTLTQSAEQRLLKMFAYLDEWLTHKGPYLCGNDLYACDYFCVMLMRWTRNFKKGPLTFPSLKSLILAVHERPAYQRMLEQEGLTGWPTL